MCERASRGMRTSKRCQKRVATGLFQSGRSGTRDQSANAPPVDILVHRRLWHERRSRPQHHAMIRLSCEPASAPMRVLISPLRRVFSTPLSLLDPDSSRTPCLLAECAIMHSVRPLKTGRRFHISEPLVLPAPFACRS